MVYKDWCITRDFTNNFSKQQAYHFIFNDEINLGMKKQIAKRLLDYKVVQEDDILKIH